MYTCGPTVYRYAHLGNLRTFMLGDLIRRGLELEGTTRDPDHEHHRRRPHDRRGLARGGRQDAARGRGRGPLGRSRSRRSTPTRSSRTPKRSASAPADRYPKATEHIPEMIELTQTLIDRGHAYVGRLRQRLLRRRRRSPGTARLSGNTLDNLREGHRDLETDPAKRTPGRLRPVEVGRAPAGS